MRQPAAAVAVEKRQLQHQTTCSSRLAALERPNLGLNCQPMN